MAGPIVAEAAQRQQGSGGTASVQGMVDEIAMATDRNDGSTAGSATVRHTI